MKSYFPYIILLFSCVLLLIVKGTVLNLPNYWDEAFPYSFAIGHMTENGPSLRSNAAPSIYTTGHPLLYYFLQSEWNILVGRTIWMQRLLPMLFSLGSLILTFLLGRKMLNAWMGSAAAFMLVCQNTFMAQSSFQLPETLITLLLLLTIYFLITSKNWAFIISATLLLLVKEPSIVLIALIFCVHFFRFKRDVPWVNRLIESRVYVIPVLVMACFYMDQYFTQGWFLFPRHTGFASTDPTFFGSQFIRYFGHLFLYSGRNITFFSVIGFLAYLVYRRRSIKLDPTLVSQLILLVVVVIGFLVFSAFNFYSNRYILCLFPLFALISSAILFIVLDQRQYVAAALGILLGSICLFEGTHNKKPTDHSLGYADMVTAQLMTIEYCVQQRWQGKHIKTGFLMSKYLTSYFPRYLEQNEVFAHVNEAENSGPTVLIISSNEKDLHHLRSDKTYLLAKKFEAGNEWCEIYLPAGGTN
ncbi:MAG: glycosyltransferase family 39 protein [Flavobacteriales bacterium]